MVAYDSSRKDTIAKGVRVAGVDIGGLSADQARARIREQVAAADREAGGRDLRRQALHAVLQGRRRARRRGRDGGRGAGPLARRTIFTRVFRDATGGKANETIAPRVTYSKMAAGRLVTRVAKDVDQPAQDAKLSFPSLSQVDSKDGLRVDSDKLTHGGVGRHRGPRPPRDPRHRAAHQGQGHQGPAGEEVPDAAGGGPDQLQAQAVQGPQAEEGLHGGGGPAGPGDARRPLRHPEQGRQRALERAQQRLGRLAGRNDGARRLARQPAQGPLAGHLRRAPASTAPTRPTRWATPPPTAACGWPSPT